MKIKPEQLNRFVYTKYFYITLGVIFTALLVPAGLNILNVKMPNIFSFTTDSIYLKIVDILILISEFFLLLVMICNFVIMFVFLKKSRARVFFRLSCLFALTLPIIFIFSKYVPFLKVAAEFVNNEFFKFSLISLIISVITFLIGILFHLAKEQENDFQPSVNNYIKVLLTLAFNILYLIAFGNLFGASNYFLIVFVEYFYVPIYTMFLGIFQIVTGSKKFLEL
ncbi:MAG: hypothetical protein IJW82_04810 [Clostridia bacterium]|nr:hypothetical protein [Clostridia bacterium]